MNAFYSYLSLVIDRYISHYSIIDERRHHESGSQAYSTI